jgi:hypothetical protein
MAKTLDQVLVDHIGQSTSLPSLQVASETTIQSAACSSAGCYYSSTLSFANESSPLPMEHNPRKLFFRMFGQGDTAQERDSIMNQKFSLLDLVDFHGRVRTLRTEPGAPNPNEPVGDHSHDHEERHRHDEALVELPRFGVGQVGTRTNLVVTHAFSSDGSAARCQYGIARPAALRRRMIPPQRD